jgi:hypothetical protein
VAFTVDDPGATVTCKLDSNDPEPCTSPYAYSGLNEAPHTVVVTATDEAGNSASDSVTWNSDTTPPDTTITSGPSGTVYDMTPTKSVTFAFTSEAGATFECRLDSAAFAPCTSPKTVAATPGAHTFAVRAIDGVGNVDPTPATRTFTYQRCNVIQIDIGLFGTPITICL